MVRRTANRLLCRPSSTTLALLLVVVAAFFLRIYNLDWDDGAYLHPDELHIANVITLRIAWEWPPDFDNLLDPDRSRLNPRADDPLTGRPTNFAYGALPLLITDAVAGAFSAATGSDWQAFYGRIYKVGRALSAVADTLTVVVVFLIGRRVFGRAAGLAAALLYALAPLPIQLSHFFTTDTWLTLFAALALFFAVKAAQTGSPRWFLAAGACFGLGLASKASIAPMALVIVGAALVDSVYVDVGGHTARLRHALTVVPGRLLAAMLGAGAGFALFEPYALVESTTYLAQLREQSAIVRGTFDVPFTRQYVGTTPVLYQAEQLARWGLGPATASLALAGLVPLVVAATRKRNRGAAVLLSWLAIQSALVMLPETKFMRYAAPLLPALLVGGGAALVWSLLWIRTRMSSRYAAVAVTAALVAAVFWTASFMTVYAGDTPRISASRWLYASVPNGSVIAAESWDLALPVPLLPGLTPQDRQLQIESIDLYRDRRPAEVADDIYRMLQRSDYVVLSSNRVSSAVPRSPWRYPVQIRYYELLESGVLGYALAAEFHRYPGVGSVRFPDDTADESFINYDHPRVLVFENTNRIDRQTYDLLMAPAVAREYTPTRHPIGDSLLLDKPAGDLPVVDDARWSERMTGNTIGALAVWLALLLVLQIVGAPIAAVLLWRFADLGWGFARLVALLLAGYVVWIAASLQIARFTAVACAVALLALGVLAEFLGRRIGRTLPVRRHRPAILGAEVTFWLVFLVFLLFRFANPDSWHPLWGGEKPMEFAHLNAILRSAHFPPYDPWFAGGYINYYYYGLYLVAYMVKLTGIPSELAFNLAQPTVIALTASGGYSLVSTLVKDVSRRSAVLGGAIGAFVLVAIGNLHSALQIIRALPEPVDPTFFEWTWAASRSITGGITEFPYFSGLYADLHAHVVALPMTLLAISMCYVMARDSRLLTVAVSHSRQRASACGLLACRSIALMVLFGSLFATNAWDIPVYAALLFVSALMATRHLKWLSLRVAIALAWALAIGIGAYLFFLPFVSNYVTLFGSLERTRSQTDLGEFLTHAGGLLAVIGVGYLALSLPGRNGAVPAAWRGPALWMLAAFAVVVSVGLALDASSSDAVMESAFVVTVGLLLLAAGWFLAVTPPAATSPFVRAVVVVGSLGILALLIDGRDTAALAAAFGTAGAAMWLSRRDLGLRFTGALIAAAAAVIVGTEFVFLADDLVTDPIWYRMNTIFKFYNQVWILLASGASVMLALLIRQVLNIQAHPTGPSVGVVSATGPFPEDAPDIETTHAGAESVHEGTWARVGLVIAGVALAASFCYPILATKSRLELRFPGHGPPTTLNAIDWMRYGTLPGSRPGTTIAFAGDKAAIDWFNRHVHGTPVIAEASIGPYRGNGSRISIATGLPTILGWDRHQRQQRYPAEIDERAIDVQRLFDSSDVSEKELLLRQYDVQYVVVGDVERETVIGGRRYASPEGIAAFDELVGDVLDVAFTSGGTTVYRVLPVNSSPVASD